MYPARTGCPILPFTETIVVVAPDPALLRSIAFALEAHGYRVDTHPSWRSAEQAGATATCFVVDTQIFREDIDAENAVASGSRRTILLTDGFAPRPPRTNVRILEKPFGPDDLLAMLRSLDKVPT